MAGTLQDEADTDYDSFSTKLSPISIRSAERIDVDDDKFPSFDDNGSLLGVIVDRSSFDEDDEITIFNGRDALSVIHRHPESLNLPQHQQYTESGAPVGGVIMKNGKVRRKMRWKPRFGKKKNSILSSNASVISALTNRSSATNRSSSTTRSFLSHFSKRSNNSFHTFHSTETPVATNRVNRPQAPHTVMRPNYQDSFTTPHPKHATIDTEGKYINHNSRMIGSPSGSLSHFTVSSSSGFRSTRLDSVQESPITGQPQEEVEVEDFQNSNGNLSGPTTPIATISVNSISSNNSVGTRSATSATTKRPPIPVSNKTTKSNMQQQSKPRRPPLFKRRLRHGKNKQGSNSSVNSNSSSQMLSASPTDTNSTASLSPLSLERENSGIPVLMGDDDEEDRRVTMGKIGSTTKISATKRLFEEKKIEDDVEESSVSPTVQSSVSGSQSGSGGQSLQSVSSAVVSANAESTNLQKRASSMNQKSSSSPTSVLGASPKRTIGDVNVGNPPSPGGISVRSTQSAAATKTQSAGRLYNRPVDRTMSQDDRNIKSKGKAGRNMTTSVPCDLDEGAFLEAEHNLRAIHNMAAEHLAHGEYEEAADVFEEILRGQQERYGQDHYRVGTALHNLGIVYMKKGDYEKAVEICQRAVGVRKDSLVPNHPDVAVSLAQLGVAHLESQNYLEALSAFRDALHIRQTLLGPKHIKCSKILNNMGCVLYSMEDFKSSKRAFDEALEIQREALRSFHSNEGNESNGKQSNTLLLSMASTLCNIGSIRLRWREFDKAIVALEEALLVSCPR